MYQDGTIEDKIMILKVAFIQLNNYFVISRIDAGLEWVGQILDFSMEKLVERDAARVPLTLHEISWLEEMLNIMKQSLIEGEIRINLTDNEQALFALANPVITYASPAA